MARPKTIRIPQLRSTLKTLEHRTALPLPKIPDNFYSSLEWIALRRIILRRDHNTCQVCGEFEQRMVVDHIIEIRDGGPKLDPRNCQTLCWSCHTTKTIAARAKRMSA